MAKWRIDPPTVVHMGHTGRKPRGTGAVKQSEGSCCFYGTRQFVLGGERGDAPGDPTPALRPSPFFKPSKSSTQKEKRKQRDRPLRGFGVAALNGGLVQESPHGPKRRERGQGSRRFDVKL